MSETRRSFPNIHQVVLFLILVGLILGTAFPARGTGVGDSWSLRDVIRTLEPGVVWVLAEVDTDTWSQGSGFIIHEDGFILTNAHVVEGAKKVIVGWPDRFNRSEKIGEIVAADSDLDLALIHIDGAHLPTIAVDMAGSACLGDAVVTLGYPVGEELGLGGLTVTRGVLSSLRQTADGDVALIQTDAAVTLGCSGGPLYDLDTSSVIGIVQGKGMLLLEGFNFAIPSDLLFDFAGTDPEDGIEAVIESLGGFDEPKFSEPDQRSLEIFNEGIDALSRLEWAEALDSFLMVTELDEEDPQAAYGLAESYAALDRSGEALQWLERAFELGFSDFEGALDSPGFSGVRDDDRFVELVQSF